MWNRNVLLKLSRGFIREVAIISAASLSIIGLARVFLHPTQEPATPSVRLGSSDVALPSAHKGLRLAESRIDLHHHKLTVFLIVSPTCRYCRQSGRFHKRLQAAALNTDVAFFVMVPNKRKAEAYLDSLNLQASGVHEWNELPFRVDATPTIVLVDHNRDVRAVWVGLVPANIEQQILNAIASPPSIAVSSEDVGPAGVPNYNMKSFSARSRLGNMTLISVAERDHSLSHSGELRIPTLELSVRAPYELNRASIQVVDCTNVPLNVCKSSVSMLISAGFQVGTLEAGEDYRN